MGFSQLSSLCTNAKEYYECAKNDDANLHLLTLNEVLSTSLSEKLRLQDNVHQIIFLFHGKVSSIKREETFFSVRFNLKPSAAVSHYVL